MLWPQKGCTAKWLNSYAKTAKAHFGFQGVSFFIVKNEESGAGKG